MDVCADGFHMIVDDIGTCACELNRSLSATKGTDMDDTSPDTVQPVNAYVLATIALHAATASKALADVAAALEGAPVMSSRAKELRARRSRLMAETDAWNLVHDYAKGIRP